eukprot:gnl/TRDRNA2_/TRDRNA2_39363_c0_seq1.p1 gnl/TRDRNA2_/TRDRNA2_39363_c0~~gnl/TRDRNA2_/TRDRNA2_39363_c0_seq1.p1  ORF type:complete len:399 (-),score=87.49 gnl/TRDRNA2_/TRDRNA2_39363_c0_seq1:36-1232(-)
MKGLDAFGKPAAEFQVKTVCGGYLSVVSFLIIGLLFVTEFKYFLELESKDEMVIDQNQDRKYLNISLDATFHEVPCAVLYMNLLDPKKANVLHVVHDIYKQRLSSTGRPLGTRIRDSLRNVASTSSELKEAGVKEAQARSQHATTHLRCGSCFHSHIDEDDCCATCDEVRKSFKDRGWAPKSENYVFEQCEEEVYEATPAQHGEGCRIVADMYVRKVAATVHIGVGQYFKTQFLASGDHQDLVTHLNFSHTIHTLSFGQDFPGLVRVLDGRKKNFHTPPNTEHYQYDIHVIPTRYIEADGEETSSHQYSVTEYVKSIDQRQRHQELVASGLWATYDFTPFEVKVTKSRKKFMHFLTECCAIMGGIFAFTGMLDTFSYRINKSLARRSRGGAVQLAEMK